VVLCVFVGRLVALLSLDGWMDGFVCLHVCERDIARKECGGRERERCRVRRCVCLRACDLLFFPHF